MTRSTRYAAVGATMSTSASTSSSGDIDVGGGVLIPGSSYASAVSAFAKNPSAETAVNAAMQSVCGIVTAGAGTATNACGFLTVANVLAFGDYLADALAKVGVPRATGVFECTFYFPDIVQATGDAYLAAGSALNTTWYATRAAMGLPFKTNADAIPYYSPAQTAYTDSAGYTHGQDAPAKLVGYESKRVKQILSKDAVWNSTPEMQSLDGARTIKLTGEDWLRWAMIPASQPAVDCRSKANAYNSALSTLYQTYRLTPLKAAVKQVVHEWSKQFDAEKAATQQKAQAWTSYAKSVTFASDAKWAVAGLVGAGLLVGVAVATARRR